MKKLSISILLLFVMILSITAVAAAEDVTSDLAKSQTVDDSAALAVESGTDVVMATPGGNFTDLQKDIDDGNVINNKEYIRDDNNKEIVISKDVTITNSIINANDKGGIFNITSGVKLTLVDVTLIGGNSNKGAAIYNDGGIVEIQGTLTLTDNKATSGGVIYNNGEFIFKGTATATSSGTTGTDIYNAKDGQITIGKGSTFSGKVYNEGTLATNASVYANDFVNNGTITFIDEAYLANGIENYATITTINQLSASTGPNIKNNGTISSMKGQFNTVTNNKNIENINGTIATLINNGTVSSMKGTFTTVTNKKNIGTINGTIATLENNGNIELINTSEITNHFENNGNITTVKASKFSSIVNAINCTIDTIEDTNIASWAFNYGDISFVNNVTFESSFTNEAQGTIDEIYGSNFKNAVTNNGNIGTIDNVNVTGAVTNNGNITDLDDSSFKDKFDNNGNIFLGISNVTIAGDVTNAGNISDIYKATFKSLTNAGNISYIGTSKVETYLVNNINCTIDSIEDTNIASWAFNYGTINYIDNVTVGGSFTNEAKATIDEIYDSNFKNVVNNNGNITLIEGATFKGGLNNNPNANIDTIRNATFIGVGIDNDGIIGLVTGSDFNSSGILNDGNITVMLSEFYGVNTAGSLVFANANGANATIGACAFINNTAVDSVIVNYGNLVIGLTAFVNNSNAQDGTIYSQGNLTVEYSGFINNTAPWGAAIFSESGVLSVANSYFANNTAQGGVIYNKDVATIKGSTFVNNNASWTYNSVPCGNAIMNEGNLTLSNNTISTKSADIYNAANKGFITAVKITVTNDGTLYIYDNETTLTATLTDVDGNWIYDVDGFEFVINGTSLGKPTAYNKTTGLYSLDVTLKGKDNITNADQTVTAKLAAKYVNATATVTNGTLKTAKGTFTELQYLINNYTTGTLVLPYNFAYNADLDNVNLTKGVVINKAITIDGNGSTISGNGAARILFLNTTGSVLIKNTIFTKGLASKGGAILTNSSYYLYLNNCSFVENTATTGGAIFINNTIVDMENSKFANNTANGVANAIVLDQGQLYLKNNTINKAAAEVIVNKGKLYGTTINATVLEGKTLNITYGELVTLTAVITDDMGNLINDPAFLFEVDGKKIPAIYDDGKYAFETNLYLTPSATVYPVAVVYNSTVTPANTITGKNGGLNVSKEDVAIVIFAKDVVAGQNATIELMAFGANGDDLNNTNVTIVVNNVPYNVTIIDGEGNITLPVLDLGTYRVYANYAGDENHNASSQVAEFGVKIATVMTISATNAGYDSALIKVTLTDASGNKLSKFVKVYVADGVYEVAVKDGEGSTLVTGLKPGAYIADAEFAFDSEYADASAQTTFTVQPAQIVVTDMKRGWNSPYDYYATLLDAKGNPVAGKEITFTIDGVTYKATTNASGIATVAAKLDVGTHTVTVTNPDTGANSTATTTIVERIQGYGNITKDYLGPESYIVQVFGDDGNPVGENVVVEVRFAGKTYEMLTNASGYIVRTINFVPGFYAVYSVYAGYQTIQTAIVVNQILKVSAVTVKKSAKSFKLTATLKSSDGKAISGKEIKFTFAGKTYKAKTNSNGVATYKLGSAVIKKLKAGKKYTYKATYVNDIVKGKITVKK